MNELIITAQNAVAEHLEAIQDPTPYFSMDAFVVGQHDMPGQQWAQCVLELQNRLMAVATTDIDIEIAHLKAERLEKQGTPISVRKAKKIRLKVAQAEYARLVTVRGIGHLLKIKARLEAGHDGQGWTREQLDAELPEYWRRRLSRQATLDLNATGRIGVGNQDALRMAGMPIPGHPDFIQQVEQRFLEVDERKILVAVPTLIPRDEITANGLQCLNGWDIDPLIPRRFYIVQGKTIDAAYTDAALTAMQDGCSHLLCVEDDHVIPAGTFERLWELHQRSGPRSIVGSWYPQRREPRTGAPVVLKQGGPHNDYSGGGSTGPETWKNSFWREYLSDDGAVHEVYACPMGFTLIPVSIFRELPQPWFVTTDTLTQDSFFSQRAREAGYKLLVDTGARIKHVDRETGKVYE